MPVFHDGIIYMSRGYRSGPYMAIRPGGKGDITKSHIVWEITDRRAVHLVARPRRRADLHGDRRRRGHRGRRQGPAQRVWQQRIDGIFSASPVAGDGKIYFVSETGETIVVRSGRTPEVLSPATTSASA